MSKKVHLSLSENDTFEIARKMGDSIKGNEIICLSGELGAGKTVFVKGVAAGLGLDDVNQVCSPSFTLMNVYKAPVPIYHLDFYRLNSHEEIEDIGWEDFIGEGVILIEWAEKYPVRNKHIRIVIKVCEDESRRIIIEDVSPH